MQKNKYGSKCLKLPKSSRNAIKKNFIFALSIFTLCKVRKQSNGTIISKISSISSSKLTPGGAFKPKECLARTKLAVIVAFRDRDTHLKVFLHHMHPIFQRQLLDYRIFVVEQTPTEEFNRGALMNIGYTEALKVDNFDCFAFHDVDLVPEDDRLVLKSVLKKVRINSH